MAEMGSARLILFCHLHFCTFFSCCSFLVELILKMSKTFLWQKIKNNPQNRDLELWVWGRTVDYENVVPIAHSMWPIALGRHRH